LIDLSLISEDNISCSAVNIVGHGMSDSLQFEVTAPPTFITKLAEKTKFVSSSSDFSLLCQVECDPICKIIWFKDEDTINPEDDGYEVKEYIIEEDFNANQFKSVSSKLLWNMDHFTDLRLDPYDLNFTISCGVADTDISVAIFSKTEVTIEYAPQNVEVSQPVIVVEEGTEVDEVECRGESSPDPSFSWKYNENTISLGNKLQFTMPMTRDKSGDYYCQVENSHGYDTAKVTLDILYRPECSVSYSITEEEILLLCTADGNPDDLTFWWERQNGTFEGQASSERLENTLRLRKIDESLGNYSCYVSNSVGEGEGCMIELQESVLLTGLYGLDLIIVAIIVGVLVLLVLTTILVWVCCKYRGSNTRAQSKSNISNESDQSLLQAGLPFDGLKNPPKKVLCPQVSDKIPYIDEDSKDLYVEGPMGYRKLPGK